MYMYMYLYIYMYICSCSVRRIIGLTPVLAKIQMRKGKHSLLHAGFVSTVGLQVTEQMNVRVEDAAHVMSRKTSYKFI